jgi:hypothetical protein
VEETLKGNFWLNYDEIERTYVEYVTTKYGKGLYGKLNSNDLYELKKILELVGYSISEIIYFLPRIIVKHAF